MPYRRVGKVIYTKSSGAWKVKQRASSIANAKKTIKLLYGLKSGSIKRKK